MPDGASVLIFFFPVPSCLGDQSLGNHRQPHFGHFSGYHSKCVARNTCCFDTQAYQKKRKENKKPHKCHPFLATSICLSLIFAVAFSFIICCSLPLYHEDIFEKRNVHECLQCPPHWNTWGKVSSLTLWSIPAPKAWATASGSSPDEDCLFLVMGNFPRFLEKGLFAKLELKSWAICFCLLRKKKKFYNRILFWWVWISVGVIVICCCHFKFQSFYGSGDCWGGATGFWGGRDGFLRCIVIKAS